MPGYLYFYFFQPKYKNRKKINLFINSLVSILRFFFLLFQFNKIETYYIYTLYTYLFTMKIILFNNRKNKSEKYYKNKY